jgi:hypothetical protein
VPALALPIIDVFTQHHDANRVDRGKFIKLAEQSICGRTAGTSFRGEEFDKNTCFEFL